MDNYKFAIIFGKDNQKNNTKDGQVLYCGDNRNGEMHIKSFLDFIEEYYKDDEMLSKINIRHQPTMPAYLLEEQGNIVFLNTTSLEEKELAKYGRNGIVFLPMEITDKQFETLMNDFEKIENYDLMIKSNFKVEDGFLHSDTVMTTDKITKEDFKNKILSITKVNGNKSK